MELVLKPISFVGCLAVWIVEFSISVHSIVFPLSLIRPAICVDDATYTVLLVVLFEALVASTYVFFDDKGSFLNYCILVRLVLLEELACFGLGEAYSSLRNSNLLLLRILSTCALDISQFNASKLYFREPSLF